MRPKRIVITINKAKATIQFSGRLGFNMDAIELMQMANRKSFFLAQDEENEEILYLMPQNDLEGDAKLAKAGSYYYLNVGDAFKNMGIKYKEYTVMYEVEKAEYEGSDIFVLNNKRSIKRKDKETDSN